MILVLARQSHIRRGIRGVDQRVEIGPLDIHKAELCPLCDRGSRIGLWGPISITAKLIMVLTACNGGAGANNEAFLLLCASNC